jgi:hypothetical protein
MKNFPVGTTHVWLGTFCKVEDQEVWFYDANLSEWFHTHHAVEILEANATELLATDYLVSMIGKYAKRQGTSFDVALKMISLAFLTGGL